jgi:hypothetical protein
VGGSASHVVGNVDQPAQTGLQCEQRKGVSAHKAGLVPAKRPVGVRHGDVLFPPRGDIHERTLLLPQLLDHLVRQGNPGRGVTKDHADASQLVGIGHRQAAQEQTVQEREHRGVRADADGEREDGSHPEGGVATQPAKAVTEVGEQGLEPDEDVAVARVLHLEDVAPEAPSRFALGLVGRGPVGDQLLGPLGEVEGHLAVDVVGDTIGPEHVTQPREP